MLLITGVVMTKVHQCTNAVMIVITQVFLVVFYYVVITDPNCVLHQWKTAISSSHWEKSFSSWCHPRWLELSLLFLLNTTSFTTKQNPPIWRIYLVRFERFCSSCLLTVRGSGWGKCRRWGRQDGWVASQRWNPSDLAAGLKLKSNIHLVEVRGKELIQRMRQKRHQKTVRSLLVYVYYRLFVDVFWVPAHFGSSLLKVAVGWRSSTMMISRMMCSLSVI